MLQNKRIITFPNLPQFLFPRHRKQKVTVLGCCVLAVINATFTFYFHRGGENLHAQLNTDVLSPVRMNHLGCNPNSALAVCWIFCG